ncbi:MFS transporter [Streptomyces sp. APSN-46.1]|nr:MFS transporter [Streptomyces sp. APSN-46.1]MCJ1676402.1 MFS transporter [Streptomyces sp. APSN-46.1]
MSEVVVGRATAPVEAVERKLPVVALLALATAVFVTSLTETLPAGLLPAMGGDLGVSESAAGQTVTVYAAGTALTAIPLTVATAGVRRKRLLMAAMVGFGAANTVTALSSHYTLTMGARFVAGVAAGLAWALLAGYARRLAPAHLQGKAVALAMAGIPVALSLGVPAGTLLGRTLGWRTAFLAMTVLTVGLLGWIAAAVPDLPGARPAPSQPAQPGAATRRRAPRPGALRIPGVVPVLAVTVVFVLAHTVLYTYIAAFLGGLGMGASTDRVLLVFGAASLAGLWVVGTGIHRHARVLTLAATLLVGGAAALLTASAGGPIPVYLAAALWGLGWGGVPTLLQTAAADAADAADAAPDSSSAPGAGDAVQATLVTLWNVAMAGGGVLGGALLELGGSGSLPWAVLLLLIPVLALVLTARRHGFPARAAA